MHQSLSFKQARLISSLLFLCSCPIVLANGFSVSTATDFTTGNYGGATSTDIWYVPFTARYDKDRASFRVIVPYLNITGPGNVIGPGIGGVDSRGTIIGGVGNPTQGGGIVACNEEDNDDDNCSDFRSSNNSGSGNESADGLDQSKQNITSVQGLVGGIPLGGSSTLRSSQSGLGDIITAFSYNLIDHVPTGILFDITARLKIPTANASQNLGTGQVDYAIQGDLFKTISQFTLSATLGYRILGSPSRIAFHDVLYGAASVGYRLSSNTTIGTSYNMSQSPVRLQDSRDLTLYLSQRVSGNFRLNIYGLKGFSERSPDWGGGINLRYIF
ncbi:MAG: hypothetical protein KA524_03300 [Nitrosomonas sp.]|nr:hypothetical protein [Nitrosomonas sp.]MBP6076297.1 hypothetical protein [Nitrosomonas sp.]